MPGTHQLYSQWRLNSRFKITWNFLTRDETSIYQSNFSIRSLEIYALIRQLSVTICIRFVHKIPLITYFQYNNIQLYALFIICKIRWLLFDRWKLIPINDVLVSELNTTTTKKVRSLSFQIFIEFLNKFVNYNLLVNEWFTPHTPNTLNFLCEGFNQTR